MSPPPVDEDLEAALGPTAGLKAEQGLKDAAHDGAFWTPYLDQAVVPPAELVSLADDIAALYASALARMTSKLLAPLDAVPATPAHEAAFAVWEAAAAVLEPANAAMVRANIAIDVVKAANAKADKAASTAAAAALAATRARHTAPFAGLATGYAAIIKAKETLVADKEAKKAELDAYDAEVLGC